MLDYQVADYQNKKLLGSRNCLYDPFCTYDETWKIIFNKLSVCYDSTVFERFRGLLSAPWQHLPCPDLSTFEPPVFRERANLKRVTSPNWEKYLQVMLMMWYNGLQEDQEFNSRAWPKSASHLVSRRCPFNHPVVKHLDLFKNWCSISIASMDFHRTQLPTFPLYTSLDPLETGWSTS